MGFAFSAGIGVSIASGGPVLVLESDGSVAMNLQDFWSIKKSATPIKVIIMDSCGYKSISLSLKRLGYKIQGVNASTNLCLPDLARVASAAELPVRIVSHEQTLNSDVLWLSELKSSGVLIVKVSPSEEAFPRLISSPNAAGVMETPTLDNLSPNT